MRGRYANDNDDDDVVVCRNQNDPIVTDPHHTHEFEQSTKLAETGDDRHNHRVAGVTSEAIARPGGRHVHALDKANTDFLDHHHEIGVTDVVTGLDIPIPGTNKHVHVVSGTTTVMDGHSHDFLFTTQINSPLV